MNPSENTAVPLRKSLRIRVGLLVSGAVLLVAAGFMLLGIGPLAQRIAASHFSVATTHLQAELDAAFKPAAQVLEMAGNWLATAPPDTDDPAAFNRLFTPVLSALPKATSVVAGDSTGRGWMLMQLPDGGWRNRLTDLQRWDDRHHFFERDAIGNSREYWQSLDYDPRRRNWYTAAGGGNGVRWTAPYTFFTTGDPGITAAMRLQLADGRDLVIGIDLMLRDLSQTTMTADIGERGLALVLTDDLRVLALPAPPPGTSNDKWLERTLKPYGELALPVLDKILSDWQGHPNQQVFRISADGTD